MSRTLGDLYAKLYPERDAPPFDQLEALQTLLAEHDFIHQVRHQQELHAKDVERAALARHWMDQLGALQGAAKAAGFHFRKLDDGTHLAELLPADDPAA